MTLRSEEIEHLVFMATHAPSVHNTQPWRFTATPSSLVLSQDTNRQVHVIDPWGRELLMSCGAALDHLEVAARAIGLDAAVSCALRVKRLLRSTSRAGPKPPPWRLTELSPFWKGTPTGAGSQALP